MPIRPRMRAGARQERPDDAERAFLDRHAGERFRRRARDRRRARHQAASSARTSRPTQRRTTPPAGAASASGWPKVGEKAKESRLSNSPGTTMISSSSSSPTARCRRSTYWQPRPSIGWEMDVAWVVRGGADPMPWIDRLRQAHRRRPCQGHRQGRPGAGRGRLGRCRPRHGRLERPDEGTAREDAGRVLRHGAGQSERHRALRQAFHRMPSTHF